MRLKLIEFVGVVNLFPNGLLSSLITLIPSAKNKMNHLLVGPITTATSEWVASITSSKLTQY